MINVKTRQATREALRVMRSTQLPDCPLAQWDHPHPPVLFWRAFVAAGGLDLDPAIWNLDRGAVAGVAQVVESALVNGSSSDKACAEFRYCMPERNDWLKVDDGHELAPCFYIEDALTDLFVNAMNRSWLAIQVLQGIADLAELDQLDEPKPLPECYDDEE